jgi:hypothetical protein
VAFDPGLSPEELGKLIEVETEKWSKAIRTGGIKNGRRLQPTNRGRLRLWTKKRLASARAKVIERLSHGVRVGPDLPQLRSSEAGMGEGG